MFTSNSYLAPETGKRRYAVVDAVAEIWRSESYMTARKIVSDNEMIQWFVRGSPNKTIRWFMSKQDEIKSWEDFKIMYVAEFGSDENRDYLLYNSKQHSKSVGE